MFDVRRLALEKGIENLRFMVPFAPTHLLPFEGLAFTSSDDPEVPTLCKIVEYRYKVDDGYKISVTPVEYEGHVEDFYQSDFNSMVRQGHITVVEGI